MKRKTMAPLIVRGLISLGIASGASLMNVNIYSAFQEDGYVSEMPSLGASYPAETLDQTKKELYIERKAKDAITFSIHSSQSVASFPVSASTSIDEVVAPAPAQNACGEEIIKIAELALGNPYQLGAPTWAPSLWPPSPEAPTDCSALTQWVYNRQMILTGNQEYFVAERLASWQAENLGAGVDYSLTNKAIRLMKQDFLEGKSDFNPTPLDCSKLEKGDLLFFFDKHGEEYRVTHVGIYYGDCKMLHASASIGMKVIISDLNSFIDPISGKDFSLNYLGARRICD